MGAITARGAVAGLRSQAGVLSQTTGDDPAKAGKLGAVRLAPRHSPETGRRAAGNEGAAAIASRPSAALPAAITYAVNNPPPGSALPSIAASTSSKAS